MLQGHEVEPSQEPGTQASGHAPPALRRGSRASSPGLASEELERPSRSLKRRSPCRHAALNPTVLQGQQQRGPTPGPGRLWPSRSAARWS